MSSIKTNSQNFISGLNGDEAVLNPLSANPTKCSNTLKQFVGNLPSNCLSVFDHFVGLALKGLLIKRYKKKMNENVP